MPFLIRTFSTNIGHGPALAPIAELFGRVERKLYRELKSGRKFPGDLAVSFYRQFDISAKMLEIIYRQLKGKLTAASRTARAQAGELEGRIATKHGQIANTGRKLVRARKAGRREAIKKLRRSLHEHKRRLTALEARLARTKIKIEDPSICFGSVKLFNAQHHLGESGVADHEKWLSKWRASRSSQFFIEGDARKPSGNSFVRLTACDDGSFDLELRLPKALAHLAERQTNAGGTVVRCVDFCKLRFPHGDAEIRQTLADGRPLSVRFNRNSDDTWTVSIMLRQEFKDANTIDLAHGALGIDLNTDHVAATLVDASGNPTMTRRIPLVTYGKSANQRQDAIRKAAAEITKLADELGVPVVAERLDFARKKGELSSIDGKRRARLLSSFAYSSFAEALSRSCVRRSIRLILVNPAYTSVIGRVKFAPRYGLSGHAAAALTIARRAMLLSERLPASDGGIPIPLADGDRVTLPRPARNVRGHVWSSWSRLSRGLSAVHAGRLRARCKTRSGSARGQPTPGAVRTGSLPSGAPSSAGRCNSFRVAGSLA